MQIGRRKSSQPQGGFTLAELMVVVVIAAILISLAVPSYITSIRKSRRTEAKTALLDLAGREERYLSTNPAGYTAAAAQLGYAALPGVVGNGYYQLSVCIAGTGAAAGTCPNGPAGPSFIATAVPVAGQSQANDLQCQSFSVDSTGNQLAFDNGGVNQTQLCWVQ
ncbi:MAG: prepilin-type N-terminal cleavage/methylation domain-containing protein [Gammaproteobacteria bacterium]|nr:prepilin-type N-terminal cleavage/methylation domain-containing protein [Gammaproteobacteria bacterium]MBV9621873.1 prepilin-type N-terminal cleavage/methylation domain-containing protein [Gammaproteobacteria bacterium]